MPDLEHILEGARRTMTLLLAAGFGLFWVHSALWMFRGLAENRAKAKTLSQGRAIFPPGGGELYRRFDRKQIVLHILVMVSFLGLSLTGLPLKFAGQGWAKLLIDLYGGPAQAGLLHRVSGGLTLLYLAITVVMSGKFLFGNREAGGTFTQRLLGPDSLCPNWRDLSDLIGMLRWFVFLGPKPCFERWTYWEKFDFLALFWGMLTIGASGLVLWFPDFFAAWLPGWMCCAATMIHTEVALLATGFIFTVHFFNTHGRPEKFPMNFVIFSGQISHQEMVEERSAQWQRYLEEGSTERFRVQRRRGAGYDLFCHGLGFIALGTGAILFGLMLYSCVEMM